MGREGKLNVYESIVAEFKHMIELGAMKEGEKLPSCRGYGYERGINPNTVERAYSELEAAGYITIQPKKGAYVSFVKGGDLGREGVILDTLSKLKDSGVTREELERAIEKIF